MKMRPTLYPGARSPEPGAADLSALLAECRRRCLRSCLTANDADEIQQGLAVLALEGRCRIERGRSAWLRTFVRRQSRKLQARRAREKTLREEPAAPQADDRTLALGAALKRLPYKMRRALELRFLYACSHAELARELRLSEGAARMLCQRALKRMRELAPDFL